MFTGLRSRVHGSLKMYPRSSRKEAGRVILLALDEGEAIVKCLLLKVAISAIESLPGGGVCLVCRDNDGATLLTRELHSYVIDDAAKKPPNRPTAPLT
jgi:hypothetical protein